MHKESEMHAFQIARMALKMMELSNDVRTPTGDTIQVRNILNKFYYSSVNFGRLKHMVHIVFTIYY